mgnify:CR=1 FL=1
MKMPPLTATRPDSIGEVPDDPVRDEELGVLGPAVEALRLLHVRRQELVPDEDAFVHRRITLRRERRDDRALQLAPQDEDAEYNRKLVEEALKKQQEQQQQQSQLHQQVQQATV